LIYLNNNYPFSLKSLFKALFFARTAGALASRCKNNPPTRFSQPSGLFFLENKNIFTYNKGAFVLLMKYKIRRKKKQIYLYAV